MDGKPSQPGDVTRLLRELGRGDPSAAEKLVPLVYGELRRLANYHLRRERPGHTLQPTALVHEAFLKMADQREADWKSRGQFIALASEVMRRILVDYARRRNRLKRGAGADGAPLDEVLLSEEQSEEILALDIALDRLEKKEPRQRRVVELRYFGGLTVDEAATALGVSPKTVRRDWTVARAWLYQQMAARPTL